MSKRPCSASHPRITRPAFVFEVRESANHVDRGWLFVMVGSQLFIARVSDASFANNSVTFAGSGFWNGRPGYSFEATATDQGEPGRGHDTFTVVVRAPNGTVVASTGGVLTTGNIQSLR